MPLNDDQLRAIGRLTVSFGQLEFSASLLLTVLVNPDNQNIGSVAFEGMPFWRVLDTIQKVSPYSIGDNPELHRQVQDWIGEAKRVARHRNDVLHAFWAHDQTSGQMIALTHRATREAATRAADLDQLAIDVALAVRQVDRVLAELLPHAN